MELRIDKNGLLTNYPAATGPDYARLKKMLQTIKIEELPGDLQKELVKHVYLDKAKEVLNENIRKDGKTLSSMTEAFFSDCSRGGLKSVETQRTYLIRIELLNQWLTKTGLHFLDLTITDANNFINDITREKGYKKGSLQTFINSIKSFYSFLKRYGHIKENPFLSFSVRVTKQDQVKKIVPTLTEIETIRNEIKNRLKTRKTNKTNQDYLMVFDLMVFSGCRSDFINCNFEITKEKNGYYTLAGNSKGSPYYIYNVSPEMIHRIRTADLTHFKNATFAKYIKRMVAGLNLRPITLHCFRHYAAHEKYKTTNDLLQVVRLLNHTNPTVTARYLNEIGFTVPTQNVE